MSVDNIWPTIRLHYGFQSTGAHCIYFSAIRYQPDQRLGELHQANYAEDNLLSRDIGNTHQEQVITEGEDLSPTLEKLVVLTCLKFIHIESPKLVNRRYGTEFRSHTITPKILETLESLLEE